MYAIKVYFSTGLNAVNVVDSPDLLNDASQFPAREFPALEILQNFFLSSVKIKTTWYDIKYADYCAIGNFEDGFFYYFIDSIRMCAHDVAELSLTPDYLTTAGGIYNLDILDGIITRCHVSDDRYGAWNIEDEFLTPSEPLLMDTHQISFGKASTVYVESTLDLGAMAHIGNSDVYNADEEDYAVGVPTVISNNFETNYYMGGNKGTPTKTSLFYANASTIREGVNRCRGLGIESAVRCQVAIPTSLVSAGTVTEQVVTIPHSSTAESMGTNELYDIDLTYVSGDNELTDLALYENSSWLGKIKKLSKAWYVVTSMSAQFIDSETNIAYEYQEVNNKRVLYGSLNRVGILTTAGNRLESNPEETRSGDAFITIRSVGDPHPTGSPYHRFKTMNGNSSTASFFINAVKGLQWKQIPLMYTEPSGNALNQINFTNSRELQDLQFSYSPTGLYKDVVETLGGSVTGDEASLNGAIISGLGGIMNLIAGAKSGSMGGVISGGSGFLSAGFNEFQNYDTYKTARKQEMQQFAIQQRVSSPQISVSYDGEAFRDFYGETVVVYRYRPTPTDVARLDTILTMYGYKVNISGKDAPVHNRQYFNYLMGNITVGGNLPKWLCDGVTMQIANGVRLWHVKPNSNYYYNNPII